MFIRYFCLWEQAPQDIATIHYTLLKFITLSPLSLRWISVIVKWHKLKYCIKCSCIWSGIIITENNLHSTFIYINPFLICIFNLNHMCLSPFPTTNLNALRDFLVSYCKTLFIFFYKYFLKMNMINFCNGMVAIMPQIFLSLQIKGYCVII